MALLKERKFKWKTVINETDKGRYEILEVENTDYIY